MGHKFKLCQPANARSISLTSSGASLLALGNVDTDPLPEEREILANQGDDSWEVALSDLPLHMRLVGLFVCVDFMGIKAIGVLLVLNEIERDGAGLRLDTLSHVLAHDCDV